MKYKLPLSIFLVSLTAVVGYWYYLRPKPTSNALFRQVSFEQLPGWNNAHLVESFNTFKISCKAFVRQKPEQVVGTDHIDLKAGDWRPACEEALKHQRITESKARKFFHQWFMPVEFFDKKPVKGLFTGYYMPLLKGSYKKSKRFHVPLYETPDNLITIDLGLFFPHLKNKKIIGRLVDKRVIPYFTRKEINAGAIKNHANVLLWVEDPIDRLFLEIQGSGIIEFKSGKRILVGYDAQNGAPYTSIAGVLIKKGVMTKDNASMQGIKNYLARHPNQRDAIINKNKSFVFFRTLNTDAALGSQGVALTPGYSMAVDRAWVPMGVPLWLSTSRPSSKKPERNIPFQRLMIAQDTGGAIKGKVRGDVYWGGGEKATAIAGHMKNEGYYWLLLPRHAVQRMEHLCQQ